MPSLLLISASGTAQRRLLEETVADFEKKGHVISGRQEGGEWSFQGNARSRFAFDQYHARVESAILVTINMAEQLLFHHQSPIQTGRGTIG